MRLFDLPQAKHFCRPRPTGAGSAQSLPHFHSSLPNAVTLLTEGTTLFDVHHANLLNSVERWLAYSLAHYRRAFDMLVPISAPWAQVTLYYSSFYAANAVLGMFGGWIAQSKTGKRLLVDVERGVAGSQELRIHRKFQSPNGANGSHRVFWDIFYDATPTISAWAPLELALALDPVNNDFAWQITERNNVNYDMFHAWEASMHFFGTFNRERLTSLSGPPALQLDKTEQMIKLALHFAQAVSLQGTALTGCGTIGTRLQHQKRLVTKAAPNLVTQSELSTLLEM
jgi:hypothetical protein